MHSLPKEYRELLEKFNVILQSKPKRGYFESIMESGQPDPLDAIEETSMVLGVGKKAAALKILENARENEEKKTLLNYIEERDKVLDELIKAIKSLPEPEIKPIADPGSKKTRKTILVVATLFVAAIIVYSIV